MLLTLRMNLIRWIQEWKYRHRLKKETRLVNQRLQLPVELLAQILEYINVKNVRTLSTLCLVSKTFFSIVAPRLYREQDFRLGGVLPLQPGLSRHLSTYIVKLYLVISWSTAVGPQKRTPQRCRSLEEAAGTIVMGCPNLETLTIYWQIGGMYTPTFDYLARLSTGRLKELYVQCTCANPAIDVYNIFSAPHMQSVTALGWNIGLNKCPNITWPDTTITTMPNLSGICMSEWNEFTELAYTRPVTKFDLRFFDERVVQLVRHHAANLTHLNIVRYQKGDREDMFQIFVRDILPQLTRLQFFGELILRQESAEAMFEDLQALKCLAGTLVFLHIHMWCEDTNQWLATLLPRIELLFPKLRMILKRGHPTLVRRGLGDWTHWRKLKFSFNLSQVLEESIEKSLRMFPST